MHVFLRPHTAKGSYSLVRGVYDANTTAKCVCVGSDRIRKHNFKEPRRHISTSNANLIKRFEQEPWSIPLLRAPSRFNFQTHPRNFSISAIYFEKEPLKPSSKVEVTVQELKKQKETSPTELAPKPVVKKSIKQKIIDELIHYYHGFRLLFIDVKISTVLVWRVLNGKTLSRREYRLLRRTVGDMFRLVPFSVFIIVPFMELLLPVFIKLFPGMLPSTFQTIKEREDKIKQNLKVKLEMAKFLQETLDDMAPQHKDHNSARAKEFSEWFHKIRTSGEQVSNEEIMKFSKLFEDEITLDSLSRSQLIALCRVLEVQTLGTNNFLRFQLRMKLRSLAADDKMIQKEGVDTLTLGEVQQACRVRGMRAYGVSEERLRSQLNQWLDLSLNERVPPSLLLLSRALMLPETIPTSDKLKATISALPETVITSTKAAIGEKEGKIDNKVQLEVLKEEERKVKEERKERREEKKQLELEKEKEKEKELLIDKAPVISATSTPILEDTATRISVEKLEKVEKKEEPLRSKDFEMLEDAIESVAQKKKIMLEKSEIQELKEQMADYREDVEDFNKAVAEQPRPEIKESKAAQRLFKSVNRMIGKLDNVLVDLEKKEEQLKKDLEVEATDKQKTQEELLKIDDIIAAIRNIRGVSDESRIDQIVKVLKKIDDDHDGSIKVEDVLRVVEIIGKENVNLSDKQMDELMELLDKEEILEVEDKIEKALQKDKDTKIDVKKEETVKTADTQKTKFEAKSTIIAPPVNSIDKPKPSDSSKML
ncbi:mitochondrial proton/calcium exchanger protein-like [Zophobas morio]|uniref:mitochondrial proton/calcium exchanger protein-like n=1 Tax=Zophobas morio TaxID=2755281 RepID=UPI0030838C7A